MRDNCRSLVLLNQGCRSIQNLKWDITLVTFGWCANVPSVARVVAWRGSAKKRWRFELIPVLRRLRRNCFCLNVTALFNHCWLVESVTFRTRLGSSDGRANVIISVYIAWCNGFIQSLLIGWKCYVSFSMFGDCTRRDAAECRLWFLSTRRLLAHVKKGDYLLSLWWAARVHRYVHKANF